MVAEHSTGLLFMQLNSLQGDLYNDTCNVAELSTGRLLMYLQSLLDDL